MKIAEEMVYDHDSKKFIHKQTHDFNHAMKYAKANKDMNGGKLGENRLVGTIPRALVMQWLNEAGVKWDDHQARTDIIKKKMLSGDFDKFRVWEGTY